MEPIQALETQEVWMLLVSLLVCVFVPMFFFSRTIPSLVPDSHPETRWVDGLRGIAAAIVAINHGCYVFANLGIWPKLFYIAPYHDRYPVMFGALGVQMFFCITGMLFAGKILSAKPMDWSDFYEKRIRRIVPAYLAAACLALLIAGWWSWPNTQDIAEIAVRLPSLFSVGLLNLPRINDFDFGRLLGVAWTLGVEWKFYFALPVIYFAVTKNRGATIAAIIAFAVADLTLSGVSSWSFFIPGALCSFIVRKQFEVRSRIKAGVVGVAAIAFLFYRAGERGNYGFEQWVTVSVIFAAIAISRPGFLNFRTFVAMGSVSYSFYLIHLMLLFLVFGMIDRYVTDLGMLSLVQYAVLAGATLAFSSIVATVSYILIEKRYMHAPSVEKPAMPLAGVAIA